MGGFLALVGTGVPTAHHTMTKNPYSVRLDESRNRPWILDLKASHFGERKRIFFETEVEAFAEGGRLVELLREKGREGLRAESGGMTMAQATRMFLTEAEGKSRSHQQKMEMLCKKLNSRWTGPVAAVEPVAVDRWLKGVSDSPTTRAMWFRYLRMFFRWAARMRFIERSPMDMMRAPKATPARNILTAAEMSALLDQKMDDDVRALVLLGGFAGLRTIEVSRMEWEDIDGKTQIGRAHV